MVDINTIHDISTHVAPATMQATQAVPSLDVKKSSSTPSDNEVMRIDSVDSGTVKKVVSDLGSLLSSLSVDLAIEVDHDAKRVVIKLVDPDTKKVIKQIPSEEMIALGKKIDEMLARYNTKNESTVTVFSDQEG